MMTFNEAATTLEQVYSKYNDIKLGIAGSYANNRQKKKSDLDVVIDGDSMRVEIMDYIKGLFSMKVDVLWLDLMRADDEEMDAFAEENDLPINEHSVYKTVMKEVKWI